MFHIGFDMYLKPIKFHPYTSIVGDIIFSCHYNKSAEIKEFERTLHKLFKDNGIKSAHDNKIVFECELNGKSVFYGFKDWTFSIGFSVFH